MLMVAMGLLWRVARYAAGQPLWGDEAFLAVSLLTRDFHGLLKPLEYYQIAPLGFMGIELGVVRLLGSSEWALRLVPFLSGVASLLLFARFTRRTIDRRSALLVVGIFAASFYPVRHATEVKPYATDLFFSMVATSLAWSIMQDRRSIGRWLVLTGLVAVGVWCSYPLVLVASGLGLTLGYGIWRDRDRRSIALFGLFGLVSAASWLAMYLIYAGPQSRSAPFYTQLKTWMGAFPPWSRPWELPFWLVDVHTGNLLAYPNGGNHFGSLATAVLVAFGLVRLRKTNPKLLALLLSPLLTTFLAASFSRYPYGTSARTSLYMAPAFCLLAGVGLTAIIRRFLSGARRRRAPAVISIGLAVMTLVATVANVGWPYKNFEDGENRRVVREIAALTRPGDRWVGFDGVEVLPDSPKLMLEHWLQQVAEVRYNVLALAPGPVRWMPDSENLVEPSTGRTWLLVHRSGCPTFAAARLAVALDVLTANLGQPTLKVFPMTRGESIDVYEFPATP